MARVAICCRVGSACVLVGGGGGVMYIVLTLDCDNRDHVLAMCRGVRLELWALCM